MLLQLFEEHKREYETLTRPGPLKIGVQIRAGDQRMEEGAVHLQMFDHFFDCASQIEVRRGGCTAAASLAPVPVCAAQRRLFERRPEPMPELRHSAATEFCCIGSPAVFPTKVTC